VTEGLRNLAAGANPMLMKRGIDAATQAVVAEIKKQYQKDSRFETLEPELREQLAGQSVDKLFDAWLLDILYDLDRARCRDGLR